MQCHYLFLNDVFCRLFTSHHLFAIVIVQTFFFKVAPGVPKNRPANGAAPLYESKLAPGGHTMLLANTWYENLEMHGNTSINPFFYGTYLAETKPKEPVTRTKNQAFQADAVGAAHQLTPSHFKKVH